MSLDEKIDRYLDFDEGITAKGRSLQEQMMNLDLKAAYERSMEMAHAHVDFSVGMLKDLSALVMKNTGGIYHTMGGSSYMNYKKVPLKLEEFCRNLNAQRKLLLDTDDIVAQYKTSFMAHFQLVTMHPWVDGNGRMSRLVMNHLQYEFGIIPSKVLKENKAEYIQSLIDAREAESLDPFYIFMFDEHIRNLRKEIEAFKKSQAFDLIKTGLDPINSVYDPIKTPTYDPIKSVLSDPLTSRLYRLILVDNKLNYAGYANLLGVSQATVKRRLGELRKTGLIVREGSNKTGFGRVVCQV